MTRKYPNFREGTLAHNGETFKQPTTDEEFVETIVNGELFDVDDIFEIWVYKGIAAIVRNEIGILE